MSWSAAQKEALARASTSSFLKWGLELRHSLFPSHVRMVDHDKDIDLTLESDAPVQSGTTQTFTATAFRFKEPDFTNQPDPTVEIEIDGVSGTLEPFLKPAIASGEPVLLTLRGFMYDVNNESVDQMLRVYHFQMRKRVATMTTISATFGYTNPATQPFPKVKYSAATNPGLA
jgi:hypothetical protein